MDTQEKLQKAIQRRYNKAYRDIKKKFLQDKEELNKNDSIKLRDLNNGNITEQQYKSWRRNLEKELQKDVRIMSSILGGADQLALDDINGVIPSEYAKAENHETYEIEKALSIDTNYTLVRPEDITRAEYGAFFNDIDKEKNSKWNQRRIRSAITQGIISGEGIPDIAKRLKNVTGMNERSAIRNARTWVMSAISMGHQDAAVRAMQHGVEIVKWWDAVMDLRTRISHRHMHMERVGVNERFSNGALVPRDPSLPPEERCNCRCQEVYMPEGITPDFDGQFRDFPDGFTEEDWLAGKDKQSNKGEVGLGDDYINNGDANQGNLAFWYQKVAPDYVGVAIDDLRKDYTEQTGDTNVPSEYINQLIRNKLNPFNIMNEDTVDVFHGLCKYFAGANPVGYSHRKGGRLRFDRKYGISDFIDNRPDLRYTGHKTLYRGCSFDENAINQLKAGATIDMRGVSSWSADESRAEYFIKNGINKRGNCKVVFVNSYQQNRKAIPYPLSTDSEVLYSGSAKFEVKSVVERDGVNYVYVKER